MDLKPKLFGTDGVRGVAGEYPLDRPTVTRIGRALGMALGRHTKTQPACLVLGEDTRESSQWISRALAAGLRSAGVDIAYAGVITTPGIAFLTRHHHFAGGVMVSASHNPYQDNGIKVLSGSGMKLPEPLELEIENILEESSNGASAKPGEDLEDSQVEPSPGLLQDYEGFLQNLGGTSKTHSKFHLVADCANGAAYQIVPELMKRLGIQTEVLSALPNGRNINAECGSLHPREMAEATCAAGADFGVALDGDADRAIFSTRDGRILDGDHILYAGAAYLNSQGTLKGQAVVGTLMTNLGLELALRQLGIGLKRTPVGDKYVLEEMLRSGINLGGEPSGHIIFSDISTAGDGLITLLEVLRWVDETGKPLDELVSPLKQFPQIIRNVRVKAKTPLDSIPQVQAVISAFRSEVGGRGRVVVRYSGTEALARVMVEAEDAEVVERHAAQIVEAIDSAVGLR